MAIAKLIIFYVSSFHAHSNTLGGVGTAQSSPLDSPDAHPVDGNPRHPMTQSVATLHSITDSSCHQVRHVHQTPADSPRITDKQNRRRHTSERSDGTTFSTPPPPSAMTPDTPSPNISSAPATPTNGTGKSFTYFKNATLPRPSTRTSSHSASGTQDIAEVFGDESWDLLELDLDFSDVNLDTSFTCDLEEKIYYRDDYKGQLSNRQTPPNSLDL